MNKKIHIAALAPYKIYPAVSGGQKNITLFYKYLSQLLPVTIISVPGNDLPGEDNIQLAPLLNSSRLRYINPFLFFRVKKFIKQNEITHLIIEHPYYGWLGRMLKTFCHVKLAVHSHNIEGLRFKSTGRWWWGILWNYEKWTHRGADMNFFITDEDLNYAKQKFRLAAEKCRLITYGIETDTIPSASERDEAQKLLRSFYHIPEDHTLILFNGILDYSPNLSAVDMILNKINPVLLLAKDLKYKIIICGKNLPASYNGLINDTDQNIIYAGFVPDISIYFKGSDIFINPITEGGGIKTKLVEALSNNLSSVSTATGSAGIPLSVAGNKMIVVPDGDIEAFCNAIRSLNKDAETGAAFFDHFYWGNIASDAAAVLSSI